MTTEQTQDEIPQGALSELPLFPLPGTVLLPHTFMSLHIFEPRYQTMMEDCIKGHGTMAIAMLDEDGEPDQHDRPAIHPIAGVGLLRRSKKTNDGRYNIILEGMVRADISDELDPSLTYRRARARVVDDVIPENSTSIAVATASLRSLTTSIVTELAPEDAAVMERLGQVDEPGRLADLVAAALLQDNLDRQRVLATCDVEERVNVVAGILGTMLIEALSNKKEEDLVEGSPLRWGVMPGDA